MSDRLPMYPLDAVVFPGAALGLHVSDDRYRALVHHLLRIADPAERVFGSVAIREGYELGAHGAQSLYRIGTRVQLTEATPRPDGSFDVVIVGRDRIRLDRLLTSGEFPVGEVTDVPEQDGAVSDLVAEQARARYSAYRLVLADLLGGELGEPNLGLPRDPGFLAWTIAAGTPLPLGERQQLLETDDAGERLALAADLVRHELVAINVIPSLPATEVARTRWSPN